MPGISKGRERLQVRRGCPEVHSRNARGSARTELQAPFSGACGGSGRRATGKLSEERKTASQGESYAVFVEVLLSPIRIASLVDVGQCK